MDPRGLQPPSHSSHGITPLDTMFLNSNLGVWMFLKTPTLKFGDLVGREEKSCRPETIFSTLDEQYLWINCHTQTEKSLDI